jgi:hypothetical protein
MKHLRFIFPALLIVMLIASGSASREDGAPDRPAVMCPECWPGHEIVGDEISESFYEGTPLIWDDCEHARHVHDWSWSSLTYRCRCCTYIWVEFENSPACPVCGWDRNNSVMEYDPCKDPE